MKQFRKGFTILEMLVVMSVFGIVMSIVGLLFTRGTSTYRHSESHIELQRSGRSIAARVTPYVSSAFNASNPSSSAILVPAAADPNNSSLGLLRFRTTEDWLSPNYPSATTSSTLATSKADLRSFTYQIRQRPADGHILLERLEEVTPGNFNATDELYLRLQKRDETITDLRFTLVRSNLLVMEFITTREMRNTANQFESVDEDFRITFNLATKGV